MNGDKYLKPAGDLSDFRNPISEDKYLKPAGDLSDFRNPISEDKYLKPAGDLSDFRNPISEDKYLKPAGDIDKVRTKEEIDDYLLTVVSGKRYDAVCEFGVLMGSGKMIVSFEELKRMVDEGDNIVSAQCLNADLGLIEVEFQKYVYDEKLMERRSRF